MSTRGDTNAHGRPVGLPVDAHEPRQRLEDGVITGCAAQRTVDAVPGDAAVDQAGEPHGELGVAESPRFQGPGFEVLDDDVRLREHPRQE